VIRDPYNEVFVTGSLHTKRGGTAKHADNKTSANVRHISVLDAPGITRITINGGNPNRGFRIVRTIKGTPC
jgi:hypothetical protein